MPGGARARKLKWGRSGLRRRPRRGPRGAICARGCVRGAARRFPFFFVGSGFPVSSRRPRPPNLLAASRRRAARAASPAPASRLEAGATFRQAPPLASTPLPPPWRALRRRLLAEPSAGLATMGSLGNKLLGQQLGALVQDLGSWAHPDARRGLSPPPAPARSPGPLLLLAAAPAGSPLKAEEKKKSCVKEEEKKEKKF